MGTSLVQQDKSTAKRKGWVAGGLAIGTVALAITAHPLLAVVGAGAAVYSTVDWFKFRAKRGMRF